MENKKLTPLSDFVLEQEEKTKNVKRDASPNPLNLIFNYAHFLMQPLTLEMLVGENKLFDGFKIRTENKKQYVGMPGYEMELPLEKYRMTIEDLANDWNHIFLTPSALKKIGIKE